MKTQLFRLLVTASSAALLMSFQVNGANYFNDDETCGSCHPAQYQKHSKSIHLQMIRPATGPDLVNVHGNLSAPNAPTPNDFTHVIGGWYKEESYIKMEQAGGTNKYTVTNFEWNPIKGTYAHDKPLRDWLAKCAGCHTTGYDPGTRTFQQLNIHCEACHGPSEEHALKPSRVKPVKDTSSEGCGFCHIRAENAATPEFAAKTFNFPIGYVLGDPSSLKFVPEALTVKDSFFPDGTSKRHRQQFLDTYYPGFRATKHYESGTACTKCHDPHSSGIVTVHDTALPQGKYGVKIYNNVDGSAKFSEWDGEGLSKPADQLCSSCHANMKPEHVHAFTPVAEAAAQSGKVTCIDCHMPDVINVDATTLRGALHTHTYHTLRPEKSLKFGPDDQPNSCTYRCHQDKGATKAERALWASQYTEVRLTPQFALQGMKLHLKGLKDFAYQIEASPDLKIWTPLATQKAANGAVEYEDGNLGLFRFYRALEK